MKKSLDKLFIVMPAYNEEKNIEYVIRSWMPILEGKSKESRIVIANSGSTDMTDKILQNLKEEFGQLIILSTKRKEHGPKVIELYNYAIEQNADFIFQTDSDGQTEPKEFPAFWDKRNKYDAVIGWRDKRKDGKARDFVEWVLCKLLFIFFGVRIPDANAPFRLLKSELLKKYIKRLPENYEIPNVMLTTYFEYFHENITFLKITFHLRRGGANTLNFWRIAKIGVKSLNDFNQFKRTL